MKVKRLKLSECEVLAMKCIWDNGGEATCPHVVEQLREKYGLDYSDTTVYTFLKILKDKGFLVSEKKKITCYTAIIKEEDYRKQVLDKTRNIWFSGSSVDMIAALVKNDKMNQEEKKELRELIDGLE